MRVMKGHYFIQVAYGSDVMAIVLCRRHTGVM